MEQQCVSSSHYLCFLFCYICLCWWKWWKISSRNMDPHLTGMSGRVQCKARLGCWGDTRLPPITSEMANCHFPLCGTKFLLTNMDIRRLKSCNVKLKPPKAFCPFTRIKKTSQTTTLPLIDKQVLPVKQPGTDYVILCQLIGFKFKLISFILMII